MIISPSLTIIDLLIKMGADVQYSDPYLPEAPKTRKYNFELKSIKISKETIKGFDLTLLSTDHDDVDYKLIENESNLIVDTRGRLKRTKISFTA